MSIDNRITKISDAKASLSKLVEQALQRKGVIRSKAGKPVAKMIQYNADATPRQLGVGS